MNKSKRSSEAVVAKRGPASVLCVGLTAILTTEGDSYADDRRHRRRGNIQRQA
jgi:hypothetical protein